MSEVQFNKPLASVRSRVENPQPEKKSQAIAFKVFEEIKMKLELMRMYSAFYLIPR